MDYIALSKKADEEFDLGRVKKAEEILQKGLSEARKKGDAAFVEFFLGELDYIKEDYKSAIVHYKSAVSHDPKNPFLLRNLGVAYSLLGKEEEAIELYDKALEIKADDYDSLRQKGVSLSILGKEEEAIELYDKALEIKADDYDSLRQKGVSLSILGKMEEAIELYDKALEIKPDNYESLQQKGVSLSKLGKEKEAIELYDKALEIKPDDYDSLRQKGVSLSELGKEEEAIELYDKALEIKPDDYNSLRQKGVSLDNLGKKEEAIELYDKALEIKPDDYYCSIFKAFALETLGKEKDSLQIFEQLEKKLDEIKDTEMRELVNFKINSRKEKSKSSDILNEVINVFQKREESFFKSINRIESKFKKFIDNERSIPEDFPSFLSVLRKWNSYTPIIPSEKGDNKGGGYFLYHAGKGIVIDPGFNFIENFHQEGFKVADIDAVLITHAHNDHTVDLESILTLVYKYNDAIEDAVREEMEGSKEDKIKNEIEKRIKEEGKKIDLFLNVGTFMKYSGWLNLKDSKEVSSVTVLMPATTYQLPEEYGGITIYTTKAKHHEIIDDKYAIGFILDINGKKIGFTGDTGWDWENNGSIVEPFLEHKPELVVAHLGSIKRQEFNYVGAKTDDERNKCFYKHHLGLLGITMFLDATKPELTIISEFGEELRESRKEIVEGIGKVLELNCLPGDIGLHIRLDDLGVYCFIEEDFVDYKLIDVLSREMDSDLHFFKRGFDQSKFINALDKKERQMAVPLSERIKTKSKAG